jgi:uncharacterized membrane protein
MSANAAPAPRLRAGSNAGSPIDGQPAVWPHAANAVLGASLATSAMTLSSHPVGLLISDVVSGVLVVLLSGLACSRRFPWAAWLLGIVGLWLMSAPLLFWAPTATAYGVSTLVGTLVIAFALLVPGMLGSREPPGPEAPPGWSYNPSAWPQRTGIVTLAFVQFFAARQLAAYQLGHTTDIWDPVFADGTRQVLDSDVSKSFPVSDAGLGAVTYLVEGLTGLLGGTRRWRTMPWAVMLFGVLIIPVGVVSIVLVVLQPLAVGAWCFLCLITALLTVVMIAPAVDEVVATWQFLRRVRREGQSLWRTFWQGGTLQVSPGEELPVRHKPLLWELADGLELMSIPWNLAVCAGLGAWLMAAPTVLGTTGAAAASDQLFGALVITFAAIGWGEAPRAARLVNIPIGVWLLAAPWILSGGNSAGMANNLAVGFAVILLSLRRGRVESRFGAWDRYVT